jgi:DNA adenine methylase
MKPLLSPFRYPGGKSWLRPIIKQWLATPVNRLVEAFAGGGNITLFALSQKLAKHATMVELDRRVAAVWEATLNGEAEWLAQQVESFKLTELRVRTEVIRKPTTPRQLAWVTLLRNRVSYGGLMTTRSGLLNEGERGNGLTSRWYPETLAARIRDINKLKRRITFSCGDGIAWLERYRNAWDSEGVAYFIDPPYLVAGKRLYAKSKLDHRRLFEVASKLKGRVLMTYDDTDDVRALAAEFGFATKSLRMLSREHQTKTELLISRDFTWLKNSKHKRRARRKT